MNRDKFFEKVDKQTKLMYLEEVLELLRECDMDVYVSHFEADGMYRWYPEEILSLIGLVDESRSNTYPWANACEKHVPDFLLKDA